MALSIHINVVGTGGFAGRSSNLERYSVEEAITPLDASLGSAGVGTINFGATEGDDSIWLLDNEIDLTDGARGTARGTIRSVSSGNYALSVSADSTLILLNATRQADPYTGTLLGAITYYLGLVNVTGGFGVEPDIATLPVTLPGWNDTVLEAVTKLCVAQQVEMSVVYNNIVFRKPRTNIAVTRRAESQSFSIDRGNPAKSVQIHYYNYEWVVDGLVYPNADASLRTGIQVDQNETLEPITVPVSASLLSVIQPTPTGFLPPNYTGGSAYVVLGSDDLPIPPAEWVSKGGTVDVSINPENASELLINVTGMIEPDDPRAPYRIGVMSSGDRTYYPALYVEGTGSFYDKKLLTVYTGATNTEVEVGITVDNELISTLEEALTAIAPAVLRYSGINYTISGNAVSINRSGTGNEFATSKLSAFNDEFAGQKMQALDDMNWSFADFDQHYADLVINQFENQLFGNAGGARVYREEYGAWFRVNSASTTESTVGYSATLDTLFGDWDTTWAGAKLSDWDSTWAGHKMRDWDVRPLMRAA